MDSNSDSGSGISDRGSQVVAWAYALFAIATCFVGLRLFVRWKIVRALGTEDGFILASLVSSMLCSVFMSLEVTQGGLGQHWASLSPAQITAFFKNSYLSILFYNISLSLTKFAIVLLCLRVFAPSEWRKACQIALAILTIYALWLVIYSIFPCTPIHKYWDTETKGWCFPISVAWYLNAALNIVTDFMTVLLPIPGIYGLQLPRKQKWGVCVVFALGFFVCIISIVRLHALVVAVSSKDSTYDNFSIGIWSVIEVDSAIVGACLPTLKPLITRFWPALLSSGRSRPTHPTSTYYQRTHDTPRHAKDPSSASQILSRSGRDSVPLEDLEMDGKGGITVTTNIQTRVHRQDEDEEVGVGYDTESRITEERRASAESWAGSGRSDERRLGLNRKK